MQVGRDGQVYTVLSKLLYPNNVFLVTSVEYWPVSIAYYNLSEGNLLPVTVILEEQHVTFFTYPNKHIDHMMLCVIEYFAKSLKVIRNDTVG